MTIPKDVCETYETKEQCLQVVLYFLDHPEERGTRARQAAQWYRENYDSKRFWRQILEIIAAGGTEFPQTEFVENNYANVRQQFLEALDGRTPTHELCETMNFNFA